MMDEWSSATLVQNGTINVYVGFKSLDLALNAGYGVGD
jgi:hypothetical protein